MNNSQCPTARTGGLVIQEVPDEVLVFDTESNKAHCLNQTAAMIWKACDGKTTVSDIAKNIASRTGKDVSDDLVWLAIDQLNENDLLETQVETKFKGESRRALLKKIGFASMVALPIIASLAAPKSVMANTSCACGSPGDCLSQTTCASTTNCNSGLGGVCAP